MLPRTAIPSAPPNSALVDEIEAAEPARSGGAAPTMASGTSATRGPAPNPVTTDPATKTGRPPIPTSASTAKPKAQTSRPATITTVRGAQRTSVGASMEPVMTLIAAGRGHKPAWRGDRPTTSWKYWAVKNDAANITRALSMKSARLALKAGTRNSRKSTRG